MLFLSSEISYTKLHNLELEEMLVTDGPDNIESVLASMLLILAAKSDKKSQKVSTVIKTSTETAEGTWTTTQLNDSPGCLLYLKMLTRQFSCPWTRTERLPEQW